MSLLPSSYHLVLLYVRRTIPIDVPACLSDVIICADLPKKKTCFRSKPICRENLEQRSGVP